MKMTMILSLPAAVLLLAGCEKAEAPAPQRATDRESGVPVESAAPPSMTTPVEAGAEPATAAHRFAGWAGKWTGVEGMYVTITPTGAGLYSLEMQSDLDTKGTYEGRDSEHGIRFERGGEALSLHRGSGDETGLKYLAGKQECLIVKTGEGYCRD